VLDESIVAEAEDALVKGTHAGLRQHHLLVAPLVMLMLMLLVGVVMVVLVVLVVLVLMMAVMMMAVLMMTVMMMTVQPVCVGTINWVQIRALDVFVEEKLEKVFQRRRAREVPQTSAQQTP
jgi:hypothetical protein